MALFTSNEAILLLNRNSLQLYSKSQQPQQVTFPVEAVNHQEITDRRLFEKIIIDFFKQFKRHKGIILLTPDILFQKQLPLSVSPDAIQTFYDTIPFSQRLVVKKTIKTSQNTFLLATNRDLYQTIVLIARQYLWEIKEVLPITIFLQYLQGHEISYQALNRALKHKDFIEVANFLKEEQVQGKMPEKVMHTSPSFKQYLMLIGSLFFLLAALTLAAMNLDLWPLK